MASPANTNVDVNELGSLIEGAAKEVVAIKRDLETMMKAELAGRGDLAKALAEAQLEFQAVKKDAENPFFKSKYADLAGIIAATQKHLAKHGLVIIQHPVTQNGHAGVETTLLHASGQSVTSTLLLPVSKQDAQGYGSAITYARRYAYQSIVGVAAEDDDDGNAAVGGKTLATPQRKAPPFSPLVQVAAESIQRAAQEEDPFLAEDTRTTGGIGSLKSPAEIKKVDAKTISPAQVKLLYARGKASGMSSEDITQFVKETFNVAPTDLNFKQLNQTLESIASMVAP